MKSLIRYRAARCRRALLRYDTAFELENCLVDFLADARHWCDRNQHSFADLDRRAYEHYSAELVDARGGRL
jgi:hypothetical protein